MRTYTYVQYTYLFKQDKYIISYKQFYTLPTLVGSGTKIEQYLQFLKTHILYKHVCKTQHISNNLRNDLHTRL